MKTTKLLLVLGLMLAFSQVFSQTPDFFIKNKFFNYSESSMGGGTVKGKANVEKIQENKIFVRIEGVRHNSDVAPGQPTEKAFSHLLEITYENGKYIFIPDVYNPGEISDDGQTLSFSGDAYFELVVTRAPSDLGVWIRNTNSYSLTSYLRTVSYVDLVSDDDGIIATEVSKLEANKQVSLVIEMLGNVDSNKDSKVRKHLYTELSKVIYKRPSGVIRFTVGVGFNNLVEKEPVQELKGILQDIQRKITNAK